MINDLGDIIISKINLLPFIDKIAGVVKIVSYTIMDKDNKPVKKTLPVYCKAPINLDACDDSRYLDLCPDDKNKSVLYLEDKGIRFRKAEGNKISFTASFDLVCWLNLPLLGVPDCSFSAIAITNIIKELIGKGVPFQSGIYQQISIKPIFEQSKNTNPFSKYTYNIEQQQILMYPYDYFVLSLDVDFLIDARCIQNIVLNPPIPCLTK
jgi:hypothetical protein